MQVYLPLIWLNTLQKVKRTFLRAEPPLQVVFSSLKSPQSLSPSQAQWSGMHRPLVHWNWLLEQERTQPTSSLPSPQSSSTHMQEHPLKGAPPPRQHTQNITADRSSPESQCHCTLMHRPLEQLNWVRGSQVGKAEKGCFKDTHQIQSQYKLNRSLRRDGIIGRMKS